MFSKIYGALRLLIIGINSNVSISGLGLMKYKAIYRNHGKLNLGVKCIFDSGSRIVIEKGAYMSIGNNFYINSNSRIIAKESIVIGSNVRIASMVSILDHEHNYFVADAELVSNGYKTSSVRIGDNVFIGDKCTILKGSKIESNVIVGANSVVNGTLEAGFVYAGAPARKVKQLL
jgi:acetyltransferase-like isoleucine patch superfamily enzyme